MLLHLYRIKLELGDKIMSSVDNLATVAGLEPANVWQYFAGIAHVPRPSKREERIRKHVRDWAAAKNLPCREDARGNVIINAPATAGCEGAPSIVLQAHLDMVPEKNAGTQHDFEKDPICLVIDKDDASGKAIVRADGTTLGADNGMGVAMAMAAATDENVKHGPLELIFTLDEEDGMTGAKAIEADSLTGRMMLNLDTEEDDTICIGCAGGCDSNIELAYDNAGLATTDAEQVLVKVAGLRGGHSGCDIHENRGNAIKLLTKALRRCSGMSLQVSDVRGGSKRNAIPREASALVGGKAGLLDALRASADQVRQLALTEAPDVNLTITAEAHTCDKDHAWISEQDTKRLLCCLTALPNGVMGMSPAVPGLVQSSNNVATISTQRNGDGVRVRVATLSRSSNASCITNICEQIAAIGRLAGGSVETGNAYPGWEPNIDSELLGVGRRVYQELFGDEPKVEAVHAGLECGIIGERVPGMDMISFGPTITGAHSPDEQIYVESVEKSWRYLRAMLNALSGAA